MSPSDEAIAIEKRERFGWELVSTQTIDTANTRLKRENGDLYSITESKNYVKLAFRRNKNMPHYDESVALEEEMEAMESARKYNYDLTDFDYDTYKANKKALKNPGWGTGKGCGFSALCFFAFMYGFIGMNVGETPLMIGGFAVGGLLLALYALHSKKVTKYEKRKAALDGPYNEVVAEAEKRFAKRKEEIYARAEELLSGK